MSEEGKFPLYSQDLILDIVTSLPLNRKREVLYANGGRDPRICELEIELYNQGQKDPGTYIGYYKGESQTIQKVADVKQAEEMAAELKRSDASIGEIILVDVSRGGK